MNSKVSGFTWVLLVVLVVVVAVLGLTGWRVYDTLASHKSSSQEATLSGFITEGPTSPVCRIGASCTHAVANHTVEVVDAQGRVVTSTSTDSSGYYKLLLKPGRYSLVLTPAVGLRVTNNQVDVTVGANTLNLSVDTGIR